jgi:hypothetical protein
MTESAIVRDVLRVLGARPDMRVWRQNTGFGRALSNGAVIKFGIIGGGDLSGLLKDGRRIEIEVKTLHGRQSLQQRQFQKMIETFNGVYIVARSAEDAVEQLKKQGYCL